MSCTNPIIFFQNRNNKDRRLAVLVGAIRHDEIGIIEACRGGHEFCGVRSRVSPEMWVSDLAWGRMGKGAGSAAFGVGWWMCSLFQRGLSERLVLCGRAIGSRYSLYTEDVVGFSLTT
jgi:hypothetical protein